MKKIVGALIGLGVAGLALIGVAAANHSWNNYHWARTANPLRLQVIDSVTATWQSEYNTALAEWSASSVIDLVTSSADETSRTRRQCRAVAGRMRVCHDSYGQNGWLGLATIGLDSNGHIDRGTAKMNDSYASYWTIPGEKRHVMCQEIGHVFGLAHTSEDGSSQNTCMDYSQSLTSQSPNAHDYAQLESIYAHVDTYNSFATSSAVAQNDTLGNDLPPGVPLGSIMVHSDEHEHVYVRSRADGGYWIFHVRLAPEPGR
jgi:hypothetical protein